MTERTTAAAVAALALYFVTIAVVHGCREPARPPEPVWSGDWAWDRVPVRVAADPEVGYDASLRAAVRTWNREAGCALFVLAEPAEVSISIGDVHESRRGWTEGYAIGGRITRAEITLHSVTDTGMAYRVLLHELGRALGLAGSGWPEPAPSAMNNAIAERDLGIVLVTHADRTALREAYCGAGR